MTVFNIRPTFPRWVFMGLFVVAFVSLQAPGVHAQALDNQALLDRIDRLERDIRTLNRQIASQGAAPKGTPNQDVIAAPKATGATPPLKFTEGEGAVSRVMVRQDALEQEIRNATGLAESMAHNIDLANARLDKLIIDLDYRLSRLEGTAPGTLSSSMNAVEGTPEVYTAPTTTAVSKAGIMPPPTEAASDSVRSLGTVSQSGLDQILSANKGAVDEGSDAQAPSPAQTPSQRAAVSPEPTSLQPASPATQPEATVADVPVEPKVSAQDKYKIAFNLTRQARYPEAEIAFKAFLDVHGDDPLAGNASYWLGETHYVRKNFMEAAQVFFQAYQKFPKGAKAPDSLLKLGMSMAAMEKPAEACATFGKLKKEFGADLKVNIEQALNRETKRLACK